MSGQQRVTLASGLVGAVMLVFLLRVEPGSAGFFRLTTALAAVWLVGALAAGPVHLTHGQGRRTAVLLGLAGGAGLALVFVAGSVVVRSVGPLREAVTDVLAYAEPGHLAPLLAVTVVNGVAEELFFRGAVFDAVPRRKVLASTLLHASASTLTGNAMLGLAALLLGVVTGHERRVTGGVLAPALTHVTWSVTMLLALPVLLPR